LSFLNGAAFRTTGNPAPYDFHDFAPFTYLDDKLPKWIDLQAEERFRYEAYDNNNLKAKADDSYILNRFRFQVDLHASSWLRVTAQVQDARSGFQNPPIGPPNTVRWDLKLAYVEVGDPEKHWFSLRVGRQLISYNNTIIANSEWRNQARSYDAAVLNLNAKREHLGIFAASAVVPQAYGVSPHQEGNNIYGAYGRLDDFLGPHSNIEPFFLWRVQPKEVVEPAAGKTTGKEDEKANGVRLLRRGDPRNRHGGSAADSRLRSTGRRVLPVPRCGGQAAHLFPVRLLHGQQQSGEERIAHHLRHDLPDGPRPLRHHRPVRLAEH
jgi:hypothetical protein